jgi:hypothetical protein
MPPPEDGAEATLAPGNGVTGGSGGKPVRRFTWKELSKLNRPENAHVAVRGKVLGAG